MKRVTGPWIGGVLAVGLLLTLVAGINVRPVTRVLEQIRFLKSGLQLPPDAQERVQRLAGPRATQHRAVAGAVNLIGNQRRGNPLPPDPTTLYARLLEADPDNAAIAYMLAAVEINQAESPAEKLESASGFLDKAAKRAVTTWHVSDQRKLWATVLRQEGHGEVEAVIFAEQLAGYLWAEAFRQTGKAFLNLADQLAAAGNEADADGLYSYAIVMAQNVLRADPVPTLALEAAELLDSAHRKRGLLASVRDRARRAADLRAASRAAAFQITYRRATERGPHNMLDPSGRSAPRPEPYRQMVSALLSTGVWAASTVTSAAFLLIFAASYGFVRWKMSERPAPVAVASRFWWLCSIGVVVSLPAMIMTASVRAVPMHEVYWASGDWVGCVLAGTVGWTIWAILIATGLWAGRRDPLWAHKTGPVWRWTALALFALCVPALLPQWGWFGRHTSWYDESYQLPWAVMRFRWLCLFPWVLGFLGAVIQGVVSIGGRLRRGHGSGTADGKRPGPEPAKSASGTVFGLRGLMLVCCVGLSAGALGLVLAERGFYRYDARFRKLFVADKKDEVTARLGPGWKAKYFSDPAPRKE